MSYQRTERSKKYEIAKIILAAVAIAGVLVIVVTLPGLAVAFKPFFQNKDYPGDKLKRSLRNLEKQRLISMTYEGDKTVIKLTKEGREKLLKFKLDEMQIKPQKKWDKKWRLVTFDIPIDYNYNRNAFVWKLKELGFKKMQKSVWICPYPCEDEIDFLKEIYRVRSFVRVVTAEKIDIQSDLFKKFSLT